MGALIQSDCDVLIKGRNVGADMRTRRITVRGHRDKAAICKPRREASEEINSGYTLMLDFQPPEP